MSQFIFNYVFGFICALTQIEVHTKQMKHVKQIDFSQVHKLMLVQPCRHSPHFYAKRKYFYGHDKLLNVRDDKKYLVGLNCLFKPVYDVLSTTPF